MILIVSTEQDDHTQAILRHLARLRVSASVWDLAHFPQHRQLAMNFGGLDGSQENILSDYEGDLACSDCHVVWWRRALPFVLHPEVVDICSRRFAYTQCNTAISGLWLALDAFWVNNPMREEEAVRKAHQLKTAQQVGLTIPNTLITNNPNRARAFVYRHGFDRTVYKAFSEQDNSWHETPVAGSRALTQLDKVCYAPVIFQERIPVQCDLRIVVIGKKVFPVAVHGQEVSQPVGHRMPIGRMHGESFELPVAVTERLSLLMERLGLVYGVVDLRLTPDGQYVFREVDPSGAWLWLETCSGLPITETFARFLASHDTGSREN